MNAAEEIKQKAAEIIAKREEEKIKIQQEAEQIKNGELASYIQERLMWFDQNKGRILQLVKKYGLLAASSDNPSDRFFTDGYYVYFPSEEIVYGPTINSRKERVYGFWRQSVVCLTLDEKNTVKGLIECVKMLRVEGTVISFLGKEGFMSIFINHQSIFDTDQCEEVHVRSVSGLLFSF